MKPMVCLCAKETCICEVWGCDHCDAQFNSQPPKLACPACGGEAIGPREESTPTASLKSDH
jgi:hypothetical protein